MRALNSMRSAVLAGAVVFTSTAYADPKVEEQIVGPAVSDAKYVVSPQGGHLATVARKGSRMMVTMDGIAGPKVDEVITPVTAYIDPRPMQALSISEQQQNQPQPVTFSKDGNHFAYVARVSQEWLLMQDNKEVLRLPAAGAVGATGGIAGSAGNTDIRLQFGSNDGKHLFFARSGFAGYELWVDGQKMPGYFTSGGGGTEGTLDPLIFADGSRFAYLASMGTHPGDKRALIVDGTDAGYFVDNLQVTADGHLVGIDRGKDGERLLVDGKSQFKARGIIAVYVAPAGHRMLSVLRHTNPDGSIGQFLLVDGKPAEPTLCQQIKRVVFSPDGKRYAAICSRSGAEFVVVDGKKGQEYQVIDEAFGGLASALTFSPDSSRVGYVANANGKKFIVLDDDESEAYDGVANFFFLPEGKRVVTFGKQGQAFPLNIDGKAVTLPANTMMQMESFTCSPDRSRYAFFTGGSPRDGGPVYVDGKETGISGTFTFSPDSKHVAIVGYRAADSKAGLFIDGNLAFPMGQSLGYRAFSTDSQHLFWMALEPVTAPNPTDSFEWVTYADGKAIAHNDRGAAVQALLFPHGFGQFDKPPPAWSVGADGALAMLAPSADGIKRIKATPGSDTGLATILQAAQAAEAKAKAEADPKFQQEKRDREVAEFRRKAAEAKAARVADQKRQQEQQSSGK